MSRVDPKFVCPDCGVDCESPSFLPPASAKLMCRSCFKAWVETFEDGKHVPLPALLCLLEPLGVVA